MIMCAMQSRICGSGGLVGGAEGVLMASWPLPGHLIRLGPEPGPAPNIKLDIGGDRGVGLD